MSKRRYIFPYQKIPSFKKSGVRIEQEEEWRRKPLMPITLRHNNNIVNYLALVDSGADFNIFHSDLAEILGIDLSSIKTKVYFGGVKQDKTPCIGYLTFIDLGIGQDFFDKTLVAFSDNISNDGYGIIGQFGFFNYFKVNFNRSIYSLELVKNSKQSIILTNKKK